MTNILTNDLYNGKSTDFQPHKSYTRPLYTSSPKMKNIPKLHNLSVEQINESIVFGIIELISNKREFVITPLSILGVSGFPIANQTEVLNNKAKTRKIKQILVDLKNKGLIKQRKSKQDYLGIKETAYNLNID